MKHPAIVILVAAIVSTAVSAQDTANWTTAEDHQHLMRQLGIRKLRPGPSGDETAPNHANYDEATANPFPQLPDALTLKNGSRITTVDAWLKERRPEIVEDFEREIVGRVPALVPKVTWTVVSTVRGMLGAHVVIGKQLAGRVDNSSHPAISVDIQMTLVTPANRTRPVPVMIMFGSGALPQALGGPAPAGRGGPPPSAIGTDPPATEQLIAAGWGFASLSPTSVQADNGAGLTKGIIGLVNGGRPRKPDDWGALRAWAWGASRGLDYLQTDTAVDATRAGIEGVSRYGKAALVTMAFDTRFAVGLIASCTKLHRRNWGEQVENLTGAGSYHWMAGNFLKYGAAEAEFGSQNAGDLPVDAHELIALCAPRPIFISHGVPERGDARWLDHQGSFMAAVAAGPVFRLLGAKSLGTSDNYLAERMPPVNAGLLDGDLAWRQHDGGHTDAPNWKHFIPWANKVLGLASAGSSADWPLPRSDHNSRIAHAQLLEKARRGRIDVYFAGDSITRRWGATDYPELLANWRQNFHGWNAANFGWGADTIQNILWRLHNGELDDVHPKVIVLLAGTNNVGGTVDADGDRRKVEDVTRGIKATLDVMRVKAPGATIVLTGIFPRNDNMAVVPTIDRINRRIAQFANGTSIRYLDVNRMLADAGGTLFDGMMDARDKLHPTLEGYQVWANALKPILADLLGPPGAEDRAPQPTGDPSASTRHAQSVSIPH